MELIFVPTLQLWPGPAITTAKVASPRSASDAGVFHDAWIHDFEVPEGKFYLADAGYPLCDVLMVPFRGVLYHLREWESCGLR